MSNLDGEYSNSRELLEKVLNSDLLSNYVNYWAIFMTFLDILINTFVFRMRIFFLIEIMFINSSKILFSTQKDLYLSVNCQKCE